MLEFAVSAEGNNLKCSRKRWKIERRKRVGGESWERLCGWKICSLFILAACISLILSQSLLLLSSFLRSCWAYVGCSSHPRR